MGRAYDRAIWRRSLRPAILTRARWRCEVREGGSRCNEPAYEVGHIVALVEGGAPYAASNLEAQCRRHNAQDGGRIGAHRAQVGRPSRRW